MPLNPLTLNVNSGIVGRPFSATVSGLSAGSTLEVGIDGTPGFSTVNGRVFSQALPYQVNTLVLRETLAGEGVRESRIDIQADGGNASLDSQLADRGLPTRPQVVQSSLTGTAGKGPGGVVTNPVGLDGSLLDFGRERLFRWFNQLKTLSPQSIALVGDSNTAAYMGPILQGLLATIHNVTVVNYAVGGTTLKQWKDGTGPYASNNLAMSNMLAANHDLVLMMYGGTNTPTVDAGGSPATFAADLDAALTAIRASANGSIGRLSIALFTSAAQSDGTATAGTPWMRDMAFNAAVRPFITAAANKFGCAFFDKNGRYPDALVDFAAGSVGVNTWLDSNRLHTVNALSDLLAQDIFDWLVPTAYRVTRGRIASNPVGPFTATGTTESLSTKMLFSHVFLEGRLNCPATTVTKDQQFASINSSHLPRYQVWNLQAAIFDGTNQPLSTIRVNVLTTGAVVFAEASPFAMTRVYLRGDWEGARF